MSWDSWQIRRKNKLLRLTLVLGISWTLFSGTLLSGHQASVVTQEQNNAINNYPSPNFSCHNLTWIPESVLSVNSKPLWVASFPGSGAEMFRSLIGSFTGGVPGASIYENDHVNESCHQQVATCKTHWPVLPMHSPLQYKEHFQPHAILLLRNPLTAFPSRLNHLWERNHKVGFHTEQAPENNWNRWIKRNLNVQLQKYKQFIYAWTNSSFHYKVTLFLPYEGLTDRSHGQEWIQRVKRVLLMSSVRVAHSDIILRCLWQNALFDRPKLKRAEHKYVPGYTEIQRSKMLEIMDELLVETKAFVELYDILRGYKEVIQTDTRVIQPAT